MNSTTKNILVFVVIVAAAIVAYSVFFKKDDAGSGGLSVAPGLVSSGTLSGDAASDQFLSALLNLQTLRLDDSLFSGPVFSNLKDFTIILIPSGNAGRPNPFAPLAGSASASLQSSTLLGGSGLVSE